MGKQESLTAEGSYRDQHDNPLPLENINRSVVSNGSSILEQYHHENMMWLRSLDFFKQENSYLKNRLAEVVDCNSDKSFLALAEHFQNQFIIKDEFMDELKHDVHAQERKISEIYLRKEMRRSDAFTDTQQKLREQMDYLEKDFTGLRNEFNHYLTQTL